MRHFCNIFFITFFTLFLQTALAQEQLAIRISFSDKDAGTHTLENPIAYMSERAVARRTKYALSMDSSDLPIPATYLNEALQLSDGVLHVCSKWMNTAVVLMPDTLELSAIRALPYVLQTKLVAYYANGLHQRPSENQEEQDLRPLGFDVNYYGAAWNQIHLSNGEVLHEEGLMGQGMLIAVIDVGFNGVAQIAAFDSLLNDGRLMDTYNFVENNDSVFQYSAHGTQVLSCMAALAPGDFVGTAPYAQYALYTTDQLATEQSIEEDNWIAAIERADSLGADVVNSSLGYSSFDNTEDSYVYSQLDGHTTLVAQAANKGSAKGMLVVSSAGNEGNNAWLHLLTPGDADSVLTVGAVDMDKIVANFSSRGPNAAGMIKPDVSALGRLAAVVNGNGQIVQQSGTSIAAPIMSGLVACLLQARPETPPAVIREIVRSYAHNHAQPNNDIGHGVPDFSLAYDHITPINEQTLSEQQVFLYPNPTQTGFYTKITKAFSRADLRILSWNGQCLLEQSLSEKAISYVDVQHLASGVYLVALTIDGHRVFKKLLVQ